MKKVIYILLALPFLIMTIGCDNHLDDGGLHSAYVNQTTVDYLKGKNKFDTVLLLFEKAGILEELNRTGHTVIIPTNFAVNRYVNQWKFKIQKELNDENYPFNFDSLMIRFPEFSDSLSMYILERSVNRADLENMKDYSLLTNSRLGNEVQIYLQESELYTEWLPNSAPLLLYYKWVKNGLDADNETNLDFEDKDLTNVCQTSGIITNTGILHVLEDDHNLFYNQWSASVN